MTEVTSPSKRNSPRGTQARPQDPERTQKVTKTVTRAHAPNAPDTPNIIGPDDDIHPLTDRNHPFVLVHRRRRHSRGESGAPPQRPKAIANIVSFLSLSVLSLQQPTLPSPSHVSTTRHIADHYPPGSRLIASPT